jgi:hypothetical protein
VKMTAGGKTDWRHHAVSDRCTIPTAAGGVKRTVECS